MTKYGDLESQDVPVRMTPTVKILVTTTAAPEGSLGKVPRLLRSPCIWGCGHLGYQMRQRKLTKVEVLIPGADGFELGP